MSVLIFLAVFGVIMMFSGIITRNHKVIRGLAVIGLTIALVLNFIELNEIKLVSIDTRGMLSFDKFAIFFSTIALSCTLLFFLLSSRDMEKVGVNYSDYFALIFFILTGSVLAASFESLLMLFLGIEIISIPLYILTGSDKKNLKSNEASLKYFLLGAFSTGLMLMGIALVYGATGSFFTSEIANAQSPGIMIIAGAVLLIFSMSFKVSAAPFHFWTPDVYDGAPSVFTSFMATVVKAAAFIGFIRLFMDSFASLHENWKLLIAMITALTLLIGNVTAVFQQSVKRMLAYSSIAQAGFMMMALLALNSTAVEGLFLYAAAYSLATIGIFAVLIKMKDFTFDGFNGFAKHQPLLAATTVIFLLSLAGIPLTAGFLSKFYMLKAIINTGGYLWLVVFGVIMAAVSVYYYFRLIQSMYFKEGETVIYEVSVPFKVTLVFVAGLVILLGIFPELLLNWFYF